MNPVEPFETLDMRVGRILKAEPHDKAKKPALKLWVDFGPLGTKTSSAQLTQLYGSPGLRGRLVVAAVNLGTRSIAGFPSEVLILGVPDQEGRVVLVSPDRDVPLGGRVF